MDIGHRVREIRKDLGMPAAELARRTGVARNTIVMIEAGSRTPSMALLERIARELRTEPSELLKEPAASGKVSAPPEPWRPLDAKGPDPLGGWIGRALSEGDFALEFERAKGSQELADELHRAKHTEAIELQQRVDTLKEHHAPPAEILEARRARAVANAQLTAAALLAVELWRGHDVSEMDPRATVTDVIHTQSGEFLAGGTTAREPKESA